MSNHICSQPQKTEKEKFAGAKATYTIESLMHDGKALQSGTSHNFGDGFARAFGIQFLDKDNQLKYVHQTSWGMSTRLIGAIIMVHGDDSGLVLPPNVAPVQLVIVPVQQHVEGVLDKAFELKEKLSKVCRVKVDDSDKMPGWKFSEYEMRGVPLRLEVGPKDIQKNQVVLVKRENREKLFVPMDELETRIPELLKEIQTSLYNKALAHREARTFKATTMDEMQSILDSNPGFIKAMWCGSEECEKAVKERMAATSRCIPFEQEKISDKCVCCGKEAKHMLYWGRAY
jgi:prolyl-tRNA synthetase